MKIAFWNYLGPRSTPQEVRDLRRASFDYHKTYGMPIIHKHKWNTLDEREGRVRRCPFHDISYDSGLAGCPYCFGTGFLGGWDDGAITYVTLADAPTDTIRPSETGVLILESHPTFTAPWTPLMGDGDILITADFEPDEWTVIREHERYVLREVNPRTMRGFQKRVQTREYKVHQDGQIDKLPFEDYRYNVPIVFDYNNVPDPPPVPPGGDPDDYPVPGGQFYTFTARGLAIIGTESGVTSETTRTVRIDGLGTSVVTERGLRIVGVQAGAHVYFEDY